METFLFSHDLVPTPGAVCFQSKGGMHHSGFPSRAPLSVTVSPRNFLVSVLLPTSPSDSSAPALPFSHSPLSK